MSTVQEIINAAAQLGTEEFLRLRQELERLEQQRWEAELTKTTAELAAANVSDEDIDKMVLRRRREGRS